MNRDRNDKSESKPQKIKAKINIITNTIIVM